MTDMYRFFITAIFIVSFPLICLSQSIAATPKQVLPELQDNYYGIYLNGHKVGYMHNQLKYINDNKTDRIRKLVSSTALRASIGGLGTVSKVAVDESRIYSVGTGELLSLSFVQRAGTGEVLVTGNRGKGNRFFCDIVAGGVRSRKKIIKVESLSEALLLQQALGRQDLMIGQTFRVSRFDPSLQQTLQVIHRVLAQKQAVVGGVKTKMIQVETKYPDLSVSETAWYNTKGVILESKVGGFFVARLEPEKVAKQIDYNHDILLGAVVKTPTSFSHLAKSEPLTINFSGFGELLPPSSNRQQVSSKNGTVTLRLTHDSIPDITHFSDSIPSKIKPYLKATPFIQSGDKRLIDTARRLAAKSKDLFTIVSRLNHYVFNHIKDAYVPAYSNALEAWKSAKGDCTEHSILFVALARALKIPARVAVGIAYWPPGHGFGWHAWGEVWLDGRWISVDPTWDQPIADVSHIKLAQGGAAEQAKIVMLLGQLKITDISQ